MVVNLLSVILFLPPFTVEATLEDSPILFQVQVSPKKDGSQLLLTLALVRHPSLLEFIAIRL